MAKDDSGGLLSKVVRFVRNPATNWSDLDHSEIDPDGGNSKQMLKDLVERKKRNDFVRKREFEMLRKLRRREFSGAQSPTQRPSFFQSSLPSKPDERALTLKKIDEIEAQMSMQWWKTKHRDSVNSSLFAASAPIEEGGVGEPELAEPPMLGPMSGMGGAGSQPAVAPAPGSGNKPAASGRSAMTPVPSAASMHRLSHPGDDSSSTDFSLSKSFAIEVGEIAHDPDLEEASIRFANGDDQGAEAGLLDALGRSGDGANLETWLTLFDLYRATGQQARFDVAAMDFANQFQRSAPQWFSMPEMVTELAESQPASSGSQAAHWSCPPLLGLKSVGVLKDVLARTPPPWRMDWTRLSMIEPASLPVLGKLLDDWAGQPVELQLTAGDHLDQILAAGTPSGDRSVSPDWWHTRMALLRVMSRMDDFELAALNYCVTYEVSPPSWEDPRCTCRSLNSGGSSSQGASTAIVSSTLQGLLTPTQGRDQSDFGVTTIDSVMLPPPKVELSGSIAGDVSGTLEKLDAEFAGADILSISCAKLVRVDFAAAGTLLNWVSMLHSQGRQVQFSSVHRLIAGFFSVIGISELARITVRTD